VARFRHRWSELQRLELEVPVRALERWAAPRLRGLVGTRTPEVWVVAEPSRATVCVSAVKEADDHSPPSPPVVAFDLHVLARGEDLVLVVANARGADLPAPPTAIAIGCVEAAIGRMAVRHGAEFVLTSPGAGIARALLPEAGARVPSGDAVRWEAIAANADAWILQAGRDVAPAAPTEDAVRAREVATILCGADDLLVDGNVIEARKAYLEALERAPRHAEIVQRIVDIDARATGRAEAALALVAEARLKGGGSRFGITAGELLLETGDVDGAIANLERVGDSEPAPAIAARAFELAARATPDAESSARWLDKALARSPRSTTARWARVEKRLALGRLEDALADTEHLEAVARGTAAKHSVWLRAGRTWQAAGVGRLAGALFERALRFAPDEPAALAGLGSALISNGAPARGAALLGQALSLAERRGESTHSIALALARALAEDLDELPSAIARASAIPPDAAEAPVARGLEGRWRAVLGDLVGAGLAFAQLRELVATIPTSEAEARTRPIASFLVEAAKMERERRRDPLAARRYLADALRLLPHDRDLRRLYREACDTGGRERGETFAIDPPHSAPTSESSAAVADAWSKVSFEPDVAAPAQLSDDDLDREARVEELTRRVHADPRDEAAADELASHLETLGRGHELLALLSAGLADAAVERRTALLPRARAALERLALQAEAAGRAEEAALYRDAAVALGS
jgi:tetratricopeptide (TPR) repeat protein